MRGWGRRIRGGLAKLKALCVPINIGNNHWIFIRVDVLQKQIELYCSFAMKNHENKKYLTAMMRYIYDELHKDTLESQRPSYRAWRRGWKAYDRSRNSPKQLNTHDCGLFTMLTIYLNSRGVEIKRTMYDQDCVDKQKLRGAVASLFVRDDEMGARSSLTSFLAGHAPGRSGRNKRKSGGTQQKSGSAAPDEKKKKARTVDTSQPLQVKGNKKRTAKSLAEDGRRQLTLDQIMLVPARRAKRKKVEASEICGGCKSS